MKTKKEAKEIARGFLEGAFTRIPAKYGNNYCQAISAETRHPCSSERKCISYKQQHKHNQFNCFNNLNFICW